MSEPQSRNEALIEAIINETTYTDPPQSRNEAILKSILDETEYTEPPQSRMEDLLIQLKEYIEEGGGGKTPTVYDYSNLVENGTFTAQEDGLYMAVATCSYQGISSLTWAEGKTPYVSEYQNGDTVTFRYAIGQLEVGDVVTMATLPQQWAANQKSVFLLKNFDIDESIEEVFVEGQRANLNVTYDVPDDDKKHFVFAVTMGRSSTCYRDDTDMAGIYIDYNRDFKVGINTLDCFFVGTGADMPTIKLYQYDGGGTLIADYII